MPKTGFIPLNIRVKGIFGIVKGHIGNSGDRHMKFFHLAPGKEERLASFLPVLHLSNEEKLHLWQKNHFEDIHMALEQHKDEKQAFIDELGIHEEEPIEQ